MSKLAAAKTQLTILPEAHERTKKLEIIDAHCKVLLASPKITVLRANMAVPCPLGVVAVSSVPEQTASRGLLRYLRSRQGAPRHRYFGNSGSTKHDIGDRGHGRRHRVRKILNTQASKAASARVINRSVSRRVSSPWTSLGRDFLVLAR